MKPLPDKVYDWLKWLSCIFFNAVGVLYSKLSAIWGWPYGEQVLETCAAIAFFLGVVIGVSTAQYNLASSKKPTYGDLEDYTED